MKITNTSLETREEQTVTLAGTVEWEDQVYGLPRAGTTEPPMWRPDSVRARVKRWRRDGEPWSDWWISYATLTGRRVRKDGSLGAEVTDRWHQVKPGTEVGQWLDAWVRNHPDLPRPVTAPAVEESAPQELDG